MKQTRLIRLWMVFLAAILLVVAAGPVPTQAAVEQQVSLVQLVVRNRTDKPIHLRLEGPRIYILSVPAETRQTFSVERGEYTYWATACGITAKSTLNMTSKKTLIMPVCGGNIKRANPKVNKLDLSNEIKPVAVKLENEARTRVLAILTGPETYVFTLQVGDENKYTIQRGEYDIRYFACGGVGNRTWVANKGYTLTFECP